MCTISLRDDGILHVDSSNVEELNSEDVERIVFIASEVGNEIKLPHLHTLSQRTMLSKESFGLSSSKFGARYKKAEAFVVFEPFQRLSLERMIQESKPSYPVKVFTCESEAINWLYKV